MKKHGLIAAIVISLPVSTSLDQKERSGRIGELFDAELSLTQTKRDELLSLVQLYKALGGGWQQ